MLSWFHSNETDYNKKMKKKKKDGELKEKKGKWILHFFFPLSI